MTDISRPAYRSCLLSCIEKISLKINGTIDIERVSRQLGPPGLHGHTLANLLHAASYAGLKAECAFMNADEVASYCSRLSLPLLVHLSPYHFVVVESVHGPTGEEIFLIYDPSLGERRLRIETFRVLFSGATAIFDTLTA